ncbi:MAG TPA: methyltransferase domain-containing protein [Acidimicrobiales bacterium]|nr:methyltransferase domain-containing protein [Acidimicrobiales bacterium]
MDRPSVLTDEVDTRSSAPVFQTAGWYLEAAVDLPHAADRRQARESAAAVVPLLLDRLAPASVVDIGCGAGHWLAELGRQGIDDYLGVDGDYVTMALTIPADHFVAADLTKPFVLDRRFDMAMSLEVAEHLPESSADTFVTSLTRLSDLIIFSAAAPGQPGPGHINTRWPSYWTALFAKHGFVGSDPFRAGLWGSEVAWWYQQNVVVYGRPERVRSLGLPAADPASIAHPELVRLLMDREPGVTESTRMLLAALRRSARARFR